MEVNRKTYEGNIVSRVAGLLATSDRFICEEDGGIEKAKKILRRCGFSNITIKIMKDSYTTKWGTVTDREVRISDGDNNQIGYSFG